jgi:CRP-like cAMP-binding protein
MNPSAFVAEPDLIRSLSQRAFPVDCRVDHELFHQGDEPTGLFVLNSGGATMFLEDANGVPVAMVPMAPGALLGLPALIGDKPYSMTAVAKAGAEVGFITSNTFSALMLSDPLLSLMILRVMASEVRSARIAIAESRSHRSRGLRRKRAGRSDVPQRAN